MPQPPIRVEGLKPMVAALREVDAGAPKQMRIALNGVANLLVSKTQPKFPRRSGAAGASVKASSTRTAARVRMGGPRAPHAPWLDFGGRVGIRKSVSRPFISGGRYLFPTLEAIEPEIVKAVQDAVAQVARDAGLDVS